MLLKNSMQNIVLSVKEFICSDNGIDAILIILIIIITIYIMYMINIEDKD